MPLQNFEKCQTTRVVTKTLAVVLIISTYPLSLDIFRIAREIKPRMDSCKVDFDMAYPILFIPKTYTKIRTNCDVHIDIVRKSSLDSGGNNISIYNGLCHIKLVESNDANLNQVESPDSSRETNSDAMPVRLSEIDQLLSPYNQSQVWIDQSTSSYVYNHFIAPVQEPYTNPDSESQMTVEQHSTNITQNVKNCKESNVFNYKKTSSSPVKDVESEIQMKVPEMATTAQPDATLGYFVEDGFESSVLFSQLPDDIISEEMTIDWNDMDLADEINSTQEDNDALKQLMSPNIQSTSKQRKTILFLGQNSDSGQTIENISYDDPTLKCAEVEMETLRGTSPILNKKKYQCDKCKQIFDHLSSFRHHMVKNNTDLKIQLEKDGKLKTCKECGRCFKNQRKFEAHCHGHGNPDLECSICQKVFASKACLRVHMKIHSRKYSCPSCFKPYVSFNNLKLHMEKIHFLFICQDENCSFISKRSSDLNNHPCPKTEVNDIDKAAIEALGNLGTTEFNSQFERMCREFIKISPVMSSNQELSDTSPDLIKSTDSLAGSNQDLSKSNQDVSGSSQDFIKSSHHLPKLNNNLLGSYQDELKPNQDISNSNQDLSGTSQNSMSGNDLSKLYSNLAGSNQDLPQLNLSESIQDCKSNNLTKLNHNLARSNQELSSSNQELSSSNQELSSSNQELSSSSTDLRERSSLDVVRPYEDLSTSVDDDEENRVRKADSVIAKVMSNKIFLISSKMARKHRYRNTCDVCLKTFDRIDELKRHLIVHIVNSSLIKTPLTSSGNWNVICEVCHIKSFTKIDKYKAHLREHSKLTLYQCTLCDKSFSDSSNFCKHKKIHSAAYFQCDLCKRKFSSKKTLECHMDLHKKSPPVQCNYCNTTFPFISILNKHVRSSHKKGDKSKFSCRFCDDICRSLKDKWDHEWRIHRIRKTIMDCLVCGSEFRKYSELKKHCLDEHGMDMPSAKKYCRKTVSSD